MRLRVVRVHLQGFRHRFPGGVGFLFLLEARPGRDLLGASKGTARPAEPVRGPAAGLAGANPAKAAWAAFRTAKGMYVIPLMFAYTPLLLIGTKPLPALEAFASALLGFTALSASMVGHMYFPFSIRGRLLLGAGALLLFWPGMAYHLAGAAVLGGVFLMQRKRLLAEGEPDINPAVAPLETA